MLVEVRRLSKQMSRQVTERELELYLSAYALDYIN